MADFENTTPETRLDGFNVYRTTYKTVGTHHIEAGILIPKNLPPGRKYPLVVKFHGGGLIVGDCLYTPWIASFFIPFLTRNAAITILPNYRLTPEARGFDILSDLSTFYTWLLHDRKLDSFLAANHPHQPIDIDYTRILVTGDSAGGYMALQSAFTLAKDTFKVVLAQYPMTDYLRRTPEERPFGEAPPSREWLDAYLAKIKPDDIISSSDPSTDEDRRGLSAALASYGRFTEFFGVSKELWPITAVDGVESLPPITIFHAKQDSLVPFGDSEAFAEKAREKGEVRLVARDGDHGFDIELKESEEGWLRDELEWVEGKWLG
ncbi:alpha/beta-hydrolase [Periconia macrospinosa]|uniref:Alpha/beta-hydrolase n=1 Tax=Periconia macrospinosa TaxID=97972 RepID=A0A2V1D971_9PLEO|nr:alpha/beta-hydrolase [Periconia macrospinosa]